LPELARKGHTAGISFRPDDVPAQYRDAPWQPQGATRPRGPQGNDRDTQCIKSNVLEGTFAMPLYSVPRRSPRSQNEEPVAVNWRRGMFRVWILVSVAWILAIPVLLLGPPVALLLFGIAAGWAFRGFKIESNPDV